MDKIKLVKEALRHNLGQDYECLRDHFQKIIDENYDFMVFISRRCYILFQMYAMIEGWTFDHVCTDLGIFAHRDELKKSRRVIVADDIGYTGKSIQNVLRRLKDYVPAQCRIAAVLFAVNIKWADQILGRKIGVLNRIVVKCRFQLTNHQCQSLSVSMVSAILESGMAYTTFVYPVIGTKKEDIGENYKLTALDSVKGLFEGYKWETKYLDLEENRVDLPWTHKLGDYSCVRIYRNPDDEECEFFLPFVFLKNIRKDRAVAWYQCVADAFEETGCTEAAAEFRKALGVKRRWQQDALEYLTSAMSCFCSKALAESLQLGEFLDVHKEEVESSLKGSFSGAVLRLLEDCDAGSAGRFFDKLCSRMEGQEDFFCENESGEGIVVNELTQYVSAHCKDKNVYEATYSIYEWLKSEETDGIFHDQPLKAICLEDVVSVLKNIFHSVKDIYLAQIECWDIGVATYRLRCDEERGIVAKCSAGEMSTVIPMLKYQDLVREYFDEEMMSELEGKGRGQTEILEDILRKASDDSRYTRQELDEFRDLFEKRDGSLYGLLIYGRCR